ncbi:hypothetical protein [Rhodoferax sp.]|uniref:hypothetical protein n=1 Tax=Rhodoferax sp. TaxID=50421 RepID=UPI00277A11E5|nr:hypothetical protein [Rhodoferax sp.]
MNDLLLWLGRLAGLAGLLLCLVALGARLSGQYFLGGFQLGTLLLVGTAGLATGCFGLLLSLTARPKADY